MTVEDKNKVCKELLEWANAGSLPVMYMQDGIYCIQVKYEDAYFPVIIKADSMNEAIKIYEYINYDDINSRREDIYITDRYTGETRKYGTDPHDSLWISPDGEYLEYHNLQNGEGSKYGDYKFTDKNGYTPKQIAEREDCIEIATNCYFNIGGFGR